MEGEDLKRSDRPNKGKPPGYLTDYEVHPSVRPQQPNAAGLSEPPATGEEMNVESKSPIRHSTPQWRFLTRHTISDRESDTRSEHSHASRRSNKTTKTKASVNSTARRLELEAELAEKLKMDEMENELEEIKAQEEQEKKN